MVSTYGAVAEALGDKRAARAVGRMMNQNPDPEGMPCFRIVYSDGGLGGFGLGVEDKIRRLQQDDIEANMDGICDFKQVFFDDFKTDFPLKKLRQKQESLSEKVVLRDDDQPVRYVAGVDVAYPKNEFEECCGACVVMDYETREVVEERTVFSFVDFPYIPSFLAFREFPIIKQVIESLSIVPSVVIVDGNGILHPCGLGLASHVGVRLNIRTIGVAKSLLMGDIQDGDVFLDDQKCGCVFFSSDRVKKPLYVSPGHRVSLDGALGIVQHMSLYKIPEPVRLAHDLGRRSLLVR
jgi:deoxyribonuclease V